MKNTLLSKSRCSIFLVLLLLLQGLWCNGETDNVAEMEKTEKEGLYNAIQGFVGNSWNGSYLYPDPCGWTPIQGVSCDLLNDFWYVTDLNIGTFHDNSLTCTENPEFRPQLFEFKHLKSLSFYNCFSSHKLITLPTDKWVNLGSCLESLEFRSNPSLIGELPSTFGDLKMLQSLVIIENGISGNLPSNIGNLRQLKRLVLSENKFTGRVFDNLDSLSELLILDLSRNSLSGYIPFSIGYLNSLLKLDLSNNLLMGHIPEEIRYLKNLTLLDLRNNNISGGLTKSIEEMSSIQEMVLSSNQIGGEITNINWEKMQNLMILDLSNLGLSGEVPNSLSKLKNLRYLGLSNNILTGNVPIDLANMPCVTSIYVDGNNLTGVLNFGPGFYRKLGRRFKAWNNPNLCYIGELMSSEHAPLGVDPCKSDVVSGSSGSKSGLRNGPGKVQEQLVWIPALVKSKDINPDNNSSFGLLKHGINGGLGRDYIRVETWLDVTVVANFCKYRVSSIERETEVDEDKRVHHLNPFDVSRLLMDNSQPGYLYTMPSNFTPSSYLELLRISLSRALVHFYPLAGRLVSVPNQSEHSCYMYVDCSKGSGARFIHASAFDLTMAQVLNPDVNASKLIQSLFDLGEASINHDGHTRPLLSVQVTELKDGVFLGVCYNHSVVDGTSLFHFNRVWSRIFTGTFSQSVPLPIVKQPDFLIGRVVKLPYLTPEEFVIRPTTEGDLMGRRFQFSSQSLKKIKAIANSDVKTSRPISTFQSLIAFVWKCITRARDLNPGDMTTCGLPLNLRQRFNPPLTNEYFGNYAIKAKATVKAGDLLVNSISWAATLLNNAVKSQDDRSARDIIKQAMEFGPELVPPTRTSRSNDVIVASSPRFDYKESEFGPGELIGYRAGCGNKGEGKVYAMLGSQGHGSINLEIRLVPQTIDALLLDNEFMSFVSLNNSHFDFVSKM
ncbi:hypothetical protein KSS87_010563 [Heliosperma pusillum]|nr:hypothetical protein KSS87_010563 [Heliosperma pusillum]